MHDDTETLEDTVVLRLTDGVHTVEGTAQVTVMPVNDNKPRLLKYMHTRARMQKHTNIHTRTNVYKYACIHTHGQKVTHAQTHMENHRDKFTCRNTELNTYAEIHLYKNTQAHTHTYKNTYVEKHPCTHSSFCSHTGSQST